MTQEPFDTDVYFELLASDPLAAANYVDQFRYQHSNPVGVISQAVNSTLAQQQAAIAEQFIDLHPNFPAGDEAAASAMRERVEQLVSQGMPFTADLMSFAFYQLQREGKIGEGEAPAPGRELGSEQPIESISDADLKKVLERNNMFR